MFCRIHKSALIKMSLVEELRPTPKGDYRVLLRGGDDLTLSRNNKDKLKLLLENAEPVHI
jgi:DNA-binding LytR/AlgR family response regulator